MSVSPFLKKQRRLNPKAYLMWAYGMCDYTMRPHLEKAVVEYREETGNKRVDFQIFLQPTIYGSDNHSSKRMYLLVAEVSTEWIKKAFVPNIK